MIRQSKPVSRISPKRLAREFKGKMPFSTIRRTLVWIRRVSAKRRVVLEKLAAIRREWWDTQEEVICHICEERILRFEDLNSDHVVPGKMGGCKDHSIENVKPAHWWCNREKGSRRNYRP